jgi:hypothetical protein
VKDEGRDKPAATAGGAANIGRRQLSEALMSAFDKQELARMLDFKMDLQLGHVVDDSGGLGSVVYNLIRYVESNGLVGKLITAAYAANPGNPHLGEVWRQAGGKNIGHVNLVVLGG